MLADTLGSLPEHERQYAYCVCGHEQAVDIAAAIAKLGSDFPVIQLKEKLRCSQCGSRPRLVQRIAQSHVKPY